MPPYAEPQFAVERLSAASVLDQLQSALEDAHKHMDHIDGGVAAPTPPVNDIAGIVPQLDRVLGSVLSLNARLGNAAERLGRSIG